MLPLRSSVWILCSCVLACGGQATDQASASTGGSAANDTKGTGGGSSTDVCESFDDESKNFASVLIVNRTSKTIYLGPFTEGGCGPTPPPFSIEKDGRVVPYFGDPCSATCEQMRDRDPLGCLTICLHAETLVLAPGEEHTVDWDGLVLTQRTLPKECVVAENGPRTDTQCRQRTQITAGTYTFAARAGTELICDSWLSPEECGSCEPTDSGGCVHSGHHVGGSTLRAETEIEIGPKYGLGGPGARPGAEPDAESGATVPIEIAFTD